MMQSNNSNHHSFHPNGIMTAPRPRQQSSGGGVGGVPRKNLFSPGPAQTNHHQLVHHKENAGNHHHLLPHPPMSRTPMKQHHYSNSNGNNGEAAVTTPMKHQYGHAAPLATPERTPRRNITTATTTTTTPSRHHHQQQHQQQYCGLSAMISMETSYRTPSKSTSKKQHRRSPMIFHTTATPMSVTSTTTAAQTPVTSAKDVAVRTTKKKHHKRGASLLTPMSLVTASSSSMMKPAATTTKKHKRSNTSSLMFTLSTPTTATATAAAADATPMRMDNTTLVEEVGVLKLKQDLFGVLPNTDTKLMYPTSSMNRHRRYQRHPQLMMTPQKNIFEMDDALSSSSSTSCGDDEDDTEVKEEQRVMPAPTTTTTAATPKQKLRRTIPLPSPNLSAALSARKKLKKQLTPPRQYYSSHAVDIDSKPDMLGLVGTGFDGLDNYRLTSTELDPSDFQIDLPTKKEILVHAQICKLMNGYTSTQRDFNFAMLSGITRTTLEKEYDKSITSDDNMIAGSCHRDVVKEVLDCADDLVVEGFFREYGGGSGSNNNRDENKEGSGTGERIEACVFSSESLRQIIVCFRGSTAAQARPVRSNLLFGRDASSILDDEKQKVGILNSFQSAYFSTSLEKALSFLLANLAARKPFFDVVMTGHSFGGAMATIASLRYAMGNSQMRVICHTFGSPRIGGEEWRQLVHSIPNLRIYRVEKAHDSFVTMPTGNEWVHCGHSIQILGEEETSVQFAAHRFDRAAPPNASLSHTLQKVATEPVRVLRSASKVVSIPIQGTSNNNGKDAIEAYVDKLRSSGDCWFTEFSGMKGEGVSGMNNEMRTLA